MNERFISYFKENFFSDEEKLKRFLDSINKPLKRTIRVNTNKITIPDLKKRLKMQSYKLWDTFIPNVFYIERTEEFDEVERRLGFTLEHLLGYFYIQELWASSSVHFLSSWKRDFGEYLILDMASSPGWKTTQLAEQYPNSFIVANEFDRSRTPQLISNIERMWCDNIWVSCYNWQYLWRLTETFDKVLLDAPCSWEWIWFKNHENLKYWNIKNIKKIADLQRKLFESWLNALKVWWEMLYSTCTMNMLENEWVVDEVLKRHPWTFEIEMKKRFWPHIDETWWFFVCKIKKIKSLDFKFKQKKELKNEKVESLSKQDEEAISDFVSISWLDLWDKELLKFSSEIIEIWSYTVYQRIKDRMFLFKLGKKIWKIAEKSFVPWYYLWRDFCLPKFGKYEIKDEMELDSYLRWMEIWEWKWFTQITYKKENIWIWPVNLESTKIKNLFPTGWLRK